MISCGIGLAIGFAMVVAGECVPGSRFNTQANRDAFMVDPERFAPAYGGWCAWAMWLRRDREERHGRADRNWIRLSSQVHNSGDGSSAPGN